MPTRHGLATARKRTRTHAHASQLAYKADRVYLDGLTANERDAIALRLQEALGEDEYMALRPAGVGAGRLFAADMGPA